MKKWLILIILFLACAIILGGIYWRILSSRPAITELPEMKPSNLLTLDEWMQANAQKAIAAVAEKLKKQAEEEFTIFAVGDIMLSRRVGETMVKKGYDYPFAKMKELISGADLSFGNLESPMKKGNPVPTGSFVFRADPENAESLNRAGFDIVSLANNHMLNQGADGLLKTFGYLSTQNVKYCGAAASVDNLSATIVTVKAAQVGFLCYSYGPDEYAAGKDKPGIAIAGKEKIEKEVLALKGKADIIIMSLHDGIEYQHTSSKHQQELARAAIDAGADIVIGHHPHVVQEVEKYKNGYIFYSLGNFVFDQMWSLDTRQGLAVKLTLSKKDKVKKVEYFPVMIEDYSQPRPVTDDEAEKIKKYFTPL